MRDRGFKSRPRNSFRIRCSSGNPSSTNAVYRVYVIQDPEGKFYVGFSEDVEKRLNQHNTGISKWTRKRGPWTLRWTSEAMSITDARKLENALKRQKGGDGFFRATGLTRSPFS